MINQIQLVLKSGIKDNKAERIIRDAGNYLGITTGKVKATRLFNINYDLPEEQVLEFAQKGLKDSILHDVYINSLFQDETFSSFVLVAKLPGVTDDEGISAQKTLADLFDLDIDVKRQHIFSQDLYLIEAALSKEELEELADKILGNKLINHFEFGAIKPEIIYIPEVRITEHSALEIIDLAVSDAELSAISKERLLSLNLAEMKAIQEYFKIDKVSIMRSKRGICKEITDCELEVIAQTWSEHCKHKEFGALINYRNVATGEERQIDSLFKTYIKGSTDKIISRYEASGNNWLKLVFTDNAGVVQIDEERVFVWKVETHNSPSAIDPYGGAITGILGNNRDPLGTGIGGAQLLFNTNVLCFGPPDYDKPLLPGQLHPRRIFEGVRKGIEDGGNKSGIPTINGAIIFDERYSGKPLVYCGTGGVMPLRYGEKVSWSKDIDAGDLIIMAGGRVGKDGIHGATFSSAEIDENSPQSAVQIGSPITQKLLSDYMQEAVLAGLIKCSTDNGAGGLSSSIGELAQISGGAEVYLERVPLKYANLMPWEIYISESQERMTFVVEEENYPALLKLAEEREVELSRVGKFTDTGYIDVQYDQKPVAYLNMDFLHNGYPRKIMEAVWQKPELSEPEINIDDHNEILLRLMSDWNICSRESVIRQYDHEVKGKTVIKPLMGISGTSPQDAAVMRLDFESWKGIAVSCGISPKYGDIDAYQMSAGAFDEAIRQIISIGGQLPDPENSEMLFWSVNDNFCVPDSLYDPISNPDGKIKLAKLVQMNQALYDMATYYNIPMTSGKDSMKNDFKSGDIKISVPPTILYSMTALIPDIRKTVTSEFKVKGDLIYQIGDTYNELGASEFYKSMGYLGANVPKVNIEKAAAVYKKVMAANQQGLIASSHDISDGGLAVCISECLLGTGLGADIMLNNTELSTEALLYSESHSRFVVSIRSEDKAKFEDLMGNNAFYIGKITDTGELQVTVNGKSVISLEINALQQSWSKTLQEI
ncbi:MAG: phosphoribosylformylglycinamidine synthase [Candidatus Cloacimonetes bacterium]|nr:phosphoribosylformylglycinamidine synthase [Candidatus Cloacimonadota bacterium]